MSTSPAEKKRHGKHYTPAALAVFLSERIISHMDSVSHLRVLDPACGDGELIFAFYNAALAFNPDVTIEFVGFDIDSDAIDVARQRSVGLKAEFGWKIGDFLAGVDDFSQGDFDVIITNPPYVRTQQLGQETAQMLSSRFGLSGRIDLTHPFVSTAPNVLREGGVLGILCSNRFLTTKSGENIRKVFQESLFPAELYDLGDTKLFNAAVLPAVVIAKNQVKSEQCHFATAYETKSKDSISPVGLFESLIGERDSVVEFNGRSIGIRVGILSPSDSSVEPWRLSNPLDDSWLEEVRAATWKTFGEIAKIRVGIKTTADKVFISDSWELQDNPPEDELLLPLVTHHNVSPWKISKNLKTRVLYPYELSAKKRKLKDIKKYPKAASYFARHAERLKGRKYVTDGGREWYEIWVPQRPNLWAKPKIVFPDISENARFAYDRTGAVVNGDCYWISLEDIGSEDVAYLMVAVANSSFGVRFYDAVCGNKLYAGRRRWMTQYVARIPLPDPSNPYAREAISIVDEILNDVGKMNAESMNRIDSLIEQAFTTPLLDGASSSSSGQGLLF